jgi:hypothetical protein
MKRIATNAAAAPTATKSPPFWLCMVGAAADREVLEPLLAGVAKVVVPNPKAVKILIPLEEAVLRVDATVAEEV